MGDNAGKVLGMRTHLAWGKLDNGPVASVRTWTHFQQMPQEDRLAHLQSIHGAKIMTSTLSTTYSSFFTTFQPSQEHLWFGCFTNDTLMAVKRVSRNGCISYFEVLDNNRLQSYTFDCSYLQDLRSAPVRVVVKTGKKWILCNTVNVLHCTKQDKFFEIRTLFYFM